MTERNTETQPYRPDPYDYDEVELIDILQVLWRWRYLIVGGTALCGLVAWIMSISMSPRYEASALLSLVLPDSSATQLSSTRAEPLTPEAASRIIRTPALAQQLVDELDLDDSPTELTASGFVDEHLEVEEVRNSNLIEVTVSFGTPELAAKLANRIAELSIQKSSQLGEQQTAKLRESIEEQLGETRARLGSLVSKIEARRQETSSNKSVATNPIDGASAFSGPVKEYVDLYRTQINPTPLELELQATRDAYRQLRVAYESSEARTPSSLRLVTRALPPASPVSPRVGLNVLLALIVGLMLFTMASFFVEYVSEEHSDSPNENAPTDDSSATT